MIRQFPPCRSPAALTTLLRQLNVKGIPMLKLSLACLAALVAAPAFAGTVVTNPVPEPVSMAMLAIGVGGVAVARAVRNRKK